MLFLGAIALICVGAGLGLVMVSSRSQHVLVREDYYAEGLKLDSHRAREASFDSMGVRLSLRADGKALLVETSGPGVDAPGVRTRLSALSLTLQLRRPDDAGADQDVPVTLASDHPPLWVAYVSPRHGHWDVRAVFSDSSGPRLEKALSYMSTP